jgi:hypothetical protein
MGIAAFLVQPAGGAAAAGGAGSSRLRQAAADVEVQRQGHQMGSAAFFASGAAAAAGAAGNSRLGQAAAGVEVVDLVGDVDKGCVDEEMDGDCNGSEGEGEFSEVEPSKHGTDGADDDPQWGLTWTSKAVCGVQTPWAWPNKCENVLGE